ncbi:MAG: hypothetical protein ABIU29_02770, partial [Chthoniobacterales bacterium]
LASHEIIEQMPQGELILAPAGERITAAHDFYAAFDASEEFSIRYQEHDIGKLQSTLIPPVGENLILAGRRWQWSRSRPTPSASSSHRPAAGSRHSSWQRRDDPLACG